MYVRSRPRLEGHRAEFPQATPELDQGPPEAAWRRPCYVRDARFERTRACSIWATQEPSVENAGPQMEVEFFFLGGLGGIRPRGLNRNRPG